MRRTRYCRGVSRTRPKRFTNWYLRDWMKALSVRQADLVDRTEYGKTTISFLVNDQQDYNPEIIRDLSAALNIAPFELLMHPHDAMGLRQLRKDALQVVKSSEALDRAVEAERTGTDG